MSALKHMLELALNPFFLMFFLLLLCLFLFKRYRYSTIKRIISAHCVALLLFSTGWLPFAVTKYLEATYPIVQKTDPKVKWVVVLGGGHYDYLISQIPANDWLSGASIKRLIEGIRLFRNLPNAQLMLSGGGETEAFSEAILLKQLTQWFSIPQERVALESKSLNTADQARALFPFLKEEPFYLVTSAIHMPRSMMLFQQRGMHPIAAPTDFTFFWNDTNGAKMIIPNAYNFYYFTIAMHEVLGRGWAALGLS